MKADSWLYNLILVINVCDSVICQLIFEDPESTQNFTRCGDSTLVSTITPLIINGTVSQTGNFPWHAGLFYFLQDKDGGVFWEQKCGGSLITDQFVLTAAHCVYNMNEKDVRVALGKIHRSWDHYEYSQQKRNVSNIVYPYDYQQGSYVFDIALLRLDDKVRMGKLVMPVCRMIKSGSEDILNKKLFVAGWGQTKNVESGSPSETLLYTDVSFLHRNNCVRFLPPGYPMFDKFCTIKNNNTEVSVVKSGDSGGGLTVVYNGQYYIIGIISVQITRLLESQITLFTNVSWPNHISWIEKEVGKYHSGFRWSANEAIQSRGCVLPKSSPNRSFCSLANGCDESCNFDNDGCLISPGSSVDNVKVVCAPGYSTRYPYAICVRNIWYPPIPECYKLCPPLKSEMLLMSCRHGEDIVDCSKPAQPGTTVTFDCAPTFLEYPEQSRQGAYSKVHTCRSSGEWSAYLPTCKPSCGVSNKDLKVLTPTIVGGQEAQLGFFPWHAGIYYRDKKDGETVWEQKCAGSLITNRLILTAAHCLALVDVKDLRVAVGKYYRSWDRNEPSEQKRNVIKIIYPNEFNRNTLVFDIGLVLVSEKIRFGEYVMPVCRDMDPAREDIQNSTLYVAGWGITEEGGTSTSDVLLYNTVKAAPKDECQRKIPSVYPDFDKLCVVKDNSSVSIVQRGDAGGGLTAIYKDGLHYIIGLTSSKLQDLSVFTNLKWRYHIAWLEREIKQLENQ